MKMVIWGSTSSVPRACNSTDSLLAVSPAISAGRSMTVAPWARASALMSGWSVLTTTSITDGVANADSMARANKVWPPILRMFFSGIPLDPPRAGMMTKVFASLFVLTSRTLSSAKQRPTGI